MINEVQWRGASQIWGNHGSKFDQVLSTGVRSGLENETLALAIIACYGRLGF